MPAKLTHEQILAVVASIGADLKLQADPQHYSFETRDRSEQFADALEKWRKVYRRITAGCDPRGELIAARKFMRGIEANVLSLLISAIEGDERALAHPGILSRKEVRDAR
jgi:hypothetical protein